MASGDDKSVTFSVSMPENMLELLDAFVEFRKSENPDFGVNRAGVLTAAFSEYVKQWAIKTLPEYRNKTVLRAAYTNLKGESC